MQMRELVKRNTAAVEASVEASKRVAEAADRQARSCATQSDVLRDQMAELRRFGDQLERRTDALLDSFALLARDLRRDEG